MLMVGPGEADGAAEAEGGACESDGTEPDADDGAPEPHTGAGGAPHALATSAKPMSAAPAANQTRVWRRRRRVALDRVIQGPSDGDSVRAW